MVTVGESSVALGEPGRTIRTTPARIGGGSGVTVVADGLIGVGAGGTAGHSPVAGRAVPLVSGADRIAAGWNSTGTPPQGG
jgi:hypothetical protein